MAHLCHCSGQLSRCCWWSCVFSLSWDTWENFPGFVCWYPGDDASWTSYAGLQWGWPWGDTMLMMASWPFCWSNERRWDGVLRLILSWMVGGKGCDEVIFWGFGWVMAACLANGELKQSPRSALTIRAGGCCCWKGLGYSFCWAFFPFLIWVTWG